MLPRQSARTPKSAIVSKLSLWLFRRSDFGVLDGLLWKMVLDFLLFYDRDVGQSIFDLIIESLLSKSS